jgi:hypothetical protein
MVSVAGEAWFEAPDLQKVMALLNADGAEGLPPWMWISPPIFAPKP